MNVIDLRDELYKRRIEIIEIDVGCVYYAEELNENDEQRIYVYSYDFDAEQERMLSFFTLENADHIEHFYAFRDSIIILFEDETNKAWLIKLDKESGRELFRKKVSLIGRFFDCVPVDENSLLIYTKADDDSRALFNRCLETTNSDTIANLYDLEKGYRYFVKDFKTAALLENGMRTFTTAHGEEMILLSDPYTNEEEKEELVENLADQLRESGDELRDNIWVVSKKRLTDAIKSGTEHIALRRAASAGLEGTVRFECISGEKMIFRAKVYKSQLEQFFEMSASNGKIGLIGDVRPKTADAGYFTDEKNGSVYYMTDLGGRVHLEGEIGSDADIVYPGKIGKMISCIDDRYIIADKDGDGCFAAIYDSRLGVTDTFEARAEVKGDTVVLY